MARITNDIRMAIRKKIEEFVTEKYDKSEIGLELEQMRKKTEEILHRYISEAFPQDEMEVLEKYDYVRRCRSFYYCVSDGKERGVGEGVLHRSWNSGSNACVVFDEAFVVPNNQGDFSLTDGICRKFSDDETEHLKMYFWAYKARECELIKIIGAYTSRVASFNSDTKMLLAHPEMAKFMPDVSREKVKVVEPTTSDKLVEAFEASIRSDEEGK